MASKRKQDRGLILGIVADTQYCDIDASEKLDYRSGPLRLSEAMSRFERQKVDAVIQLGDLIDHDLISFEKILPVLDCGNIPIFNVLGNHEFIIDHEAKENLTALLKMPSNYYSRDMAGWRFLFLDGNEISFNACEEGSQEYKNVERYYESLENPSEWWNGAVGSHQLEWVKSQLNDAERCDLNVVIFCHFPIVPKDKYCLWNRKELLQALESYSCVKAWISGHRHAGSKETVDGVLHWTAKAMVLTGGNSFSFCRLHNEGISVEGVGHQESFDGSW